MSQPITDFSKTDIRSMSLDTGIEAREICKFLGVIFSADLDPRISQYDQSDIEAEDDWEDEDSDPDNAVYLHQVRHQDKVLWGTEHQHQIVLREIARLPLPGDLVAYYEDIPYAAFHERKLVLEEIAYRFYQPSTGE